MSIKNKSQMFIRVLDSLFPAPGIPLSHKDPFTLLVAVVLSGRSTDAVVNRVTPKLFAAANTPKKMAALTPAQIRKIIKPCGLSPAKSKYLHDLSAMLIDRFHGKVPKTFKELELLPGVGHKTASVVMCQAFGIPAFPVDTHIYRLARRWGISSAKSLKKVEEDLKLFFPEKNWIKLHLQMIYFGRQYCPARGHHPETCPICSTMKVPKEK